MYLCRRLAALGKTLKQAWRSTFDLRNLCRRFQREIYYSTFESSEVKGVKTSVLLLKSYAKKTIVLTSQRP